MRNIGILGGSFNPIHKAHIKLALKCIDEAKLDKVLVIPSYVTNLKDNSSMASDKDRLKMCTIACQNHKNLEVSDIELQRKGISYTSDTIRQLKNDNDNLFLIIGADQFLSFDKWHEYEYIIKNSTLIVAPRNNDSYFDLLSLSDNYKDSKIIILKDYIDDISSTNIRELLSSNKDVYDFIDDNVYKYICQNNLYKG